MVVAFDVKWAVTGCPLFFAMIHIFIIYIYTGDYILLYPVILGLITSRSHHKDHYEPINSIQMPIWLSNIAEEVILPRFCRFAMFSMDSACVGHLTARPLMATAEGDDETAVMCLDRLMMEVGDVETIPKLHHKWQWGLVNQVFLLRRWILDVFFASCLMDRSLDVVGSNELLEVPMQISSVATQSSVKFRQVFFVVFLFPGIWQILELNM